MSETSLKNKQIAQNTAFMYIRMFITVIIGLYTSRVVLSTMGFSDYGLYNVIGGIVAMFGVISGGLYNATMRFITFYQGKNNFYQQTIVYSMSVYIHIILAIILVILGETIGLWYLHNKLVIPEGREFAAQWLYQLSIFTASITLINVPNNASVIAHEKMSAFAYMAILNVVLKLLIVFAITYAPFDKLILYASLLFGVTLLDFLIYMVYCKQHFKEVKIIKAWDSSLFKDMFSFAGWGVIGSAAFISNTQGINLLMNLFFGTSINAARGIAVQVETIVKQFMGNVQTAINPQIIKSYSSGDRERMFSLVYASSRYCFYLMLLIVLPLIFICPLILRLWLGKYPNHTESFLSLILINSMLDSIINPLWTANNATGKVKVYSIVVNGVSLLFLPIMYWSLKYFLIPEIVFVILIISSIVGVIVRLFVLRRNLMMSILQFIKKVIIPILSVSCISILCPLILVYRFDCNEPLSAFIIVIVCIVSTGLSIYYIGISNKERYLVRSKINNIVNSKIR